MLEGSLAPALLVVSCGGDERNTKAEVPTVSPGGSVQEGIFVVAVVVVVDHLHFVLKSTDIRKGLDNMAQRPAACGINTSGDIVDQEQ